MTVREALLAAHAYEPLAHERASWSAFLAGLPEPVREVAEKFRPWRPYRMKSTGTVVVIHCFDEPKDRGIPVTLQVLVTCALNETVTFDRRVFGVPPNDLEEWSP